MPLEKVFKAFFETFTYSLKKTPNVQCFRKSVFLSFLLWKEASSSY